MINLIVLASASLVLIWLFTISDLYVPLCAVFNCHTLRTRLLVPLLILCFFGGALLAHPSDATGIILEADWMEELIILLAIVCAILAGKSISKFSPAALAIAGAYIGFDLLKYGDVSRVWGVPVTWLASFATAVALGWVFNSIFRYFTSRSNKHYLMQMWRVGILCSIAALILSFAAGFNSGAFAGIREQWEIGLFVLAPLAAIPFLPKKIFRLEERYFSINPISILAIICSVAVSCLIFSFEPVYGRGGGAATLLSPGLLTFGAFIGCGFAQGQESLDAGAIFRLAGNFFIVPITALSVSYLLCLALHVELAAARFQVTVGVLVLVTLTAIGIIATLALRFYNSVRFSGKAIEEQEELMDESRRVLNNMEIKTMRVENEYLRNQLELKQKELIGIAVNITEQKEFIHKLSDMANAAAKQKNAAQKDEAIRQICSELDLRLNFENEIDSFYTRVEQLHKDFTLRLSELYPDLTKQERRLTTLLRLGFSSKYIASLMNITPKSVEICRHRLRTKLGLKREQNLALFIKSI